MYSLATLQKFSNSWPQQINQPMGDPGSNRHYVQSWKLLVTRTPGCFSFGFVFCRLTVKLWRRFPRRGFVRIWNYCGKVSEPPAKLIHFSQVSLTKGSTMDGKNPPESRLETCRYVAEADTDAKSLKTLFFQKPWYSCRLWIHTQTFDVCCMYPHLPLTLALPKFSWFGSI